MANKTLDLDDYISQRKEKDSEFAKNFDTGYEEFKIGMMIKEMRLESGMTQEQLAEKLETKKSVISRMENHSEDIRLSTLQKVASVFGKYGGLRMMPMAQDKVQLVLMVKGDNREEYITVECIANIAE
ncbi:ribosome-binding protein aMBF1 (putative translation factor) [Treponema rectale]|uniref:Ribosome-binding protein aMBF1 (Putative translation factor) n=1 Tax=Treponema rectale TaxID=744512 RepID=A0A840SDN8_9SPIR|nr:helix-turn-helix transcriptional regulator [Treponema rectale]MBB5218974.1 ribosome-binding protein aMBF1 (putative translation factor) [Treponema rectale]